MRISERLLTILVLCLLAAAVPASGRGSGEARLKQAQELLAQAQDPLRQAGELLARDSLVKAEYDQAVGLIVQAMTSINPALVLIDQVREENPDLRELPPAMLATAGALVDARQYKRAWDIVLGLIEAYPDYRAQADALVQRIMGAQRQFNVLYEELSVIIKEKPTIENTARGNELIANMEALYPSIDPTEKTPTTDWIAQAKEQFARREEDVRFRKVMEDAAVLLAAGRYPEAISVYLDGFQIGRENYGKKEYPALLRVQVDDVVSQIDKSSREIAAGVPAALALPAALDALLAGPVTTAGREAFAQSLDQLAQAGNRESRLRALGARIPELQSAIALSQGESGRPDYWLGVIGDYTLGRSGASSPEGLVHAARQPWVTTVRKLSDTAEAASEAASTDMTEAFARAARLPEFRPFAEEARNRAALAIRVLEAETPAWQEAGLALGSEEAARSAKLPALIDRFRQHIADADAWETFTAARDQGTAASADLDRLLQAIQLTGSDAAGLRTGRSATAEIREAAVAGAAAWSDRLNAAVSGSVMASQASTVRDGYAAIASRALDRDVSLAHGLAVLEASGFAARSADAESRRIQGRALAGGTVQGVAGKRPDLGNEQYVRALADIGVLLSDIDAWNARWSAEPAHVSASAAMSAETAAQAALRSRVVTLQTAIAADAAAARTALALATQLRGQGDTAFQAGQNEEKAKKYTDALTSYTTAQKSYTDSLEQQENAAARARLAELPDIIDRITTQARTQNLAEVQKLIDRGVQQFTDTDFETAIATLEAARALWEAAAGGTNPTIDTFLDRATSALKVAGKQEITRTDPIYEDIRGFMTQAERSYDKAVSIQKSAAGSDEYRNAIASARTSVQAITAVVPEYREARLLALKIDRIELGPTEFAAEVKKRVDASLADAKNSRSTEIVLRDAYYSLKDYKALDGIESILTAARRREIDSAIISLEVALGLRRPPPDPKKVAESAAYYRQANTEYRKNTRDAINAEAAMWLLDLSLAANVLNTDAAKLRNEIVVKRGTSVDVLSPTELTSYRTAVQDYASRNYATAEARVDELLKARPRNPLLLALKRQLVATR